MIKKKSMGFGKTVRHCHRTHGAQEILDKEITMKKFCMLVMMFLAVGVLTAQEEPAKKGQEPSTKRETPEIPRQAATPTYKMAFSVYELQEGKKINQRDFSLFAQADDRGGNKLKIGTRVPINIGKDNENVTYVDVGLDLDCSAVETVNNKVAVRIELNLTSFAIPEQNADPRTAGSRPVLRSVSERLRAVLTPGKPQVITSMDDVNSNKRMQVEVTATRLE
jgi:hypothetical protein